MNFNFTESPEFDLNTSLIEEVINLYGVLIKFLLVEKVNRDDIVFGDHSHLKSNSEDIFEMYMLPEISEDWDTTGISFGDSGLINFENINLFVSRKSIDDMEIDRVVGNILVLPNNKIMEITNASWEVPGINNLFTYADTRSVLKLSCKTHDHKLINELDTVDISAEDDTPYETLDAYFAELTDISDDQDTEAEITPNVSTVEKTGDIDNKVLKPIVDNTEKTAWGEFE